MLEVSSRIAAAGADVEVLCAEPGGPPLREERRDGVEIRAVRAWPANRDYYFAPRLWREMSARGRPDVIHVQSYHTLVAPLAMLRALAMRVPYVVTFHGGGHSSDVRNRARRLQRLLIRPLLSRASRLIAVARFEIDEYSEELGLGPEKFVLIPNGTDLAFSEARANSTGDRGATIASVGRLERYKGHDRVIASFPAVLEREPGARLIIVGTGPYDGALRRQAAELKLGDRIEFTSTPPDKPTAMAELMRGVSVVALMSEFETHPLVALEAAAAGCRLVVADSSGLGELAADGFARGVSLDASAEELAEAIVEELKLPPPTQLPTMSSWDDCAAALLELYRSVAK